MKYMHHFIVNASIARVAEFHSHASSMSAITPPPIVTKINQAPNRLKEGDCMDFTMWLGPLPVRWLAKIEEVTLNGFTDGLIRGPFSEWTHRHIFQRVDDQTTEVLDQITMHLRPHWFWGPVGLSMVLGLPFLFAYRAWKTKKILE